MNPRLENELLITRRHFFGRASSGIGIAALASLLTKDWAGAESASETSAGGLPGILHFTPTAKRVIFLFQSGAPSQMDMYDYKPRLAELRGSELPGSIRMGQRLTGMTPAQASFPVAPSIFTFAPYPKPHPSLSTF